MAADFYDSINPVTGRTYNEQFGIRSSSPQQSTIPNTLTTSRDMRNEQQTQGANFLPYLESLQSLISDPSSIQNDPAYQFRLQQGNQAINRSAAAKGMLGSGNVLAELANYGQGMASEEYGNQFNRLSDLMKNAQQFGVATDYWKQPTYGASVPSSTTNYFPSNNLSYV